MTDDSPFFPISPKLENPALEFSNSAKIKKKVPIGAEKKYSNFLYFMNG